MKTTNTHTKKDFLKTATVLNTDGVFIEWITVSESHDFHKISTEIHVTAQSVSQTVIFPESLPHSYTEQRHITIADGVDAHFNYILLGQDAVDFTIHYSLGKNARVSHNLICVGNNKQKFIVTEQQECRDTADFVRSQTHAILTDGAQAKYDGSIIIREHASRADTRLDARAMILSQDARATLIPGLQIETNDVKAAHSATVSRISTEDIFYMKSRGISEEQLYTMYIDGIIAPFLKTLDAPEQNKVLTTIKNKLS